MRFRQNINKPRKKLQISGNIVAEKETKERQNIMKPMQKINNRRIYNLLLLKILNKESTIRKAAKIKTIS